MSKFTLLVKVFLVDVWIFPYSWLLTWIPLYFKGSRPNKIGEISLCYAAFVVVVEVITFTIYGWHEQLFNVAVVFTFPNLCFALYFWLSDVAPGLFNKSSSQGHVRGASIASEKSIKKYINQIDKDDDGSILRIGGVPIPFEQEPLSILLAGSPGTGKSQIIKSLVRTMKTRGDIIICADPSGDLMKSFFVEGDFILNPFDSRGVKWCPLAEIDEPWEAARLAKAIVPDGIGNNAEWVGYAQSLLTAVIQKMGPTATNKDFLEALTVVDNGTLKKIVAGTPAERMFSDGGSKMLDSIRSIIATELTPWSYLDPTAGKSDWSIKRYVTVAARLKEEGDAQVPSLWMPYSSNQRAILRPLLGAWLDLISTSIMSLDPSNSRRICLIADELPALRKVGSLKETLAEGRKFGVVCVAGLQSVAQLREAYGDDGAQSLLACFQNVVTLRVSDTETADYMSKKLGDGEFEEVKTSTSVSHDGNESTTTSTHRDERRIVLSSDIQGLENMRGYLDIAGPTPICPIQVTYVEFPQVMKSFISHKEAKEAASGF